MDSAKKITSNTTSGYMVQRALRAPADQPAVGIVFIADISGFTQFVKTIDPLPGQLVMAALLESVLESNRLGLQVAEIEGDAVVFYCLAQTIPLSHIQEQYELMLSRYNQTLKRMASLIPPTCGLSLKAVVHTGPLSTYRIGAFTKLYGTAVIEAHRLLKNNLSEHTYLLLTEDYLRQAAKGETLKDGPGLKSCQYYDQLGPLCFSHVTYPADFTFFPEPVLTQ